MEIVFFFSSCHATKLCNLEEIAINCLAILSMISWFFFIFYCCCFFLGDGIWQLIYSLILKINCLNIFSFFLSFYYLVIQLFVLRHYLCNLGCHWMHYVDKLASKPQWSPCLSLLSTGIEGLCHHNWSFTMFL